MKINKLITNVNRWNGRYGEDVEYIVMHYTAGDGDTAKGNCQYFQNDYHAASAHFFVDKTSIWQCVELEDTAWHCGDNQPPKIGCYNINSVGIEMCSKIDKNGVYFIPKQTVKRTAKLVLYLLELYPNAKLCRHFDVTGKACPMPWVFDESHWINFQKMIEEGRPMTDAERKEVESLKNEIKTLKSKNEQILKKLETMKKTDESLSSRIGNCESKSTSLSKQIKEVDQRTEVRYDSVDACPKWLKSTVQKLVNHGSLKGDKTGLALTHDLARMMTINDREGVYDKK